MQKILLFLLIITLGYGVMNADSYTITFYNSSVSESDLTSSTRAITIISDGTSYVTTQPFTVNNGKCYYGGGTSQQVVRLGKSGEDGNDPGDPNTVPIGDIPFVSIFCFIVAYILYKMNKP